MMRPSCIQPQTEMLSPGATLTVGDACPPAIM